MLMFSMGFYLFMGAWFWRALKSIDKVKCPCFMNNNNPFDLVESSMTFKQFLEEYKVICFGFDFCVNCGIRARVYTFINKTKDSFVKVLNFLPVNLGFMRLLPNTFNVEKRQSGDYVFTTELKLKHHNYYEYTRSAFLEKEEDEYTRVENMIRIKEHNEELKRKRSRTFLYDFSGDDLSLDSNMW